MLAMQEDRAAVAIGTKPFVRVLPPEPLLQDEPAHRREAASVSEAKGHCASWM